MKLIPLLWIPFLVYSISVLTVGFDYDGTVVAIPGVSGDIYNVTYNSILQLLISICLFLDARHTYAGDGREALRTLMTVITFAVFFSCFVFVQGFFNGEFLQLLIASGTEFLIAFLVALGGLRRRQL